MGDISRKRVYAHVKQDRFILDNAEVATNWSGSTDVTDIALSANHREGTNSISFDKDGTTQAYGQITRTLAAAETINLAEYLDGVLGFWINLSSLTNVANVQLIIGESASHNYIYQYADTSLSAGWNKVEFDLNTPTSTTGDGAAWSSINYIAIKVNFDAVGNTLTAMLVDTIYVKYSITSKTEITSISGSGLATEAKQDTGNTNLSNIYTRLNNGSAKILPYATIPESGVDATGADTYATILTPSTTFSRIMIINNGVHPAVISIDGGVTDTFKYIPVGAFAFDGVAITTASIQAKNYTAGSNYTNLSIIVF